MTAMFRILIRVMELNLRSWLKLGVYIALGFIQGWRVGKGWVEVVFTETTVKNDISYFIFTNMKNVVCYVHIILESTGEDCAVNSPSAWSSCVAGG